MNTADNPGSAAVPSAAASDTASAAPNNTPNVETIFSLAIHPVTTATDALHSPNPSGANIHCIDLPMLANIESSISHIPPKLKLDKNHIRIVDPNIIVPAFIANPLTFSHACINTLFKVGILY